MAADSPLTPAWLHGPMIQARVMGVYPHAAYLLPDPETPPEVLALVGPAGLLLPGAVRLVHPDDLASLRLFPGASVQVGRGRIEAPGRHLQIRRRWRPRPLPVGPGLDELASAPQVAALRHALVASPARPGLPTLAGLARDALQDPSTVPSLLGLGPGLTPSGDDVLAGIMLTLRALGTPESWRDRLAHAIESGLHRTTALSASLLRAALLGHAVPVVVDLLAFLQRPSATDPADLVRQVATIGHSSGPDLLVGVRVTLEHCIPTSVALLESVPSIHTVSREA